MDFKSAFINDLLYSIRDYRTIEKIIWSEDFTLYLCFGSNFEWNSKDEEKLLSALKDLCEEYEYDFLDIRNRLTVCEDIVWEPDLNLKINQ